MLVEVAQSLDGVGWEVGVPVLAAAEAADGPLSMAGCALCSLMS